MSKYKLIIFDLDDTLFAYKETEIRALSKVCSMFNLLYTDEIYILYKLSNNMAKKSVSNYLLNLEIFRQKRAEIFLNKIGRTDVPVNLFVDEFLKESEQGLLIDGVPETLKSIKIPCKVIGTNGSTYPRYNKLVNSEISHFFLKFYSAEMLKVSKPNPEFFLKICKDQCILPCETFVVGNNIETDAWGAFNAGIDSCIINRFSTFSNLPINSQVISDIRKLPGVLL